MACPLPALTFSESHQTESLGTSVLQSGRDATSTQPFPGWEGEAADSQPNGCSPSPVLRGKPPCDRKTVLALSVTLWKGTPPNNSHHHPQCSQCAGAKGWKPDPVKQRGTREKKEAQAWTFHPCLGLNWKIPCPAPLGHACPE